MSDARKEQVKEASEAVDLLRALKALEGNLFWQRAILPKFEAAMRDHLDGATSVHMSPQQRAEHIHAYHFARGLVGEGQKRPSFLQNERARLEGIIERARGDGITNADFEE